MSAHEGVGGGGWQGGQEVDFKMDTMIGVQTQDYRAVLAR